MAFSRAWFPRPLFPLVVVKPLWGNKIIEPAEAAVTHMTFFDKTLSHEFLSEAFRCFSITLCVTLPALPATNDCLGSG